MRIRSKIFFAALWFVLLITSHNLLSPSSFSGEETRALVRGWFEELAPSLGASGVELSFLRLPEEIAVPRGGVRTEVMPVSAVRGSGRHQVQLTFYDEQRRVIRHETVEVQATFVRWGMVAAVDCKRGTRLTNDLVGRAAVPLGTPAAASETELLDRELVRDVKGGDPLSARMVRQPLAVRCGQMVSVRLRRRNMEINAYGRALASGRLGETVSVRLSRGTRSGTIAGDGQVDIIN